MKLASKLYLGFGVVVVIAAVLGYMGYSSLGNVGQKVLIGDEANRFIKIVNDARLAEKNFIMRGDEKYAKQMLGQKEPFDTLVEEITAHMNVAADKQLVVEMQTEFGTYIDNASHYVELDKQTVELASTSGPIVQSARAIRKLAGDMDRDQDMELVAVMDVQANIAKGSRAHLEWAGGVKDFLADKNAILNVQTDGHKCEFGKWLESSKFNEQAVFCGQQFRELINGMKQKHLELHSSVIEVADARTGTTDTSLQVYQKKTAPILDTILSEFVKAEDILNVKVAERLANANDTKRINELVLEIRREEKNYFLRATDEYVEKTNSIADSLIALADDLKARFNQQVNKDQIQQVIDAIVTYKKAFGNIVNNKAKQKVCENDMVAAARKVTEAANNLRSAKREEMDSVSARANFVMITLAIAGVIIGTFLAFIITRGITRPIGRIIADLTDGAEQVASASGQVSSTSQSLAEGATEQAAGLEETSSSLEEMSSMTKQNSENAQQANTLSGDARKAGDTGTEAMTRMTEAIREIRKSSDETAKIIKTIDEIAFQTNLLALNAAVEAARAGEAGKGFAVVAEEVRNLAMRSAEAAKNTSAMIEESVKNSQNGVDIAEEVAGILGEITSGVGKTTDLVGEIAAASQEQAQGIDQLNNAMGQMDKVTQQNAANAEESAAAAEELSAQAMQMNGAVGELVALVGGSTETNGQAQSPRSKTSTASKQGNRKPVSTHASQSSSESVIPMDDDNDSNDFSEFNG